MNHQELAKKLEGFQTIFSMTRALNISSRTAINYISKLKKSGYVQETSYGHNKLRMYYIKPYIKLKLGCPGIYDIINQYSKVKIVPRYNSVSHDKISIEEALVRAVKSENFRTILASLGLFNHVNWSKLYKIAKTNNIARNLGALYDVAKKIIKLKKIDNRTRNALIKSKGKKFIIKNFKSKDFKDIEKYWKVFIPFNKQDLLIYKE